MATYGSILTYRTDLIYKELSYETIGCLFDVFNELGPGHPERVYQKAVEVALQQKGILFKRQALCKLDYQSSRIGVYFPDIIIDSKIVLELKVRKRFSRRDFDQIKKYLFSENIKLGILATFCDDGVKFARVLNIISSHSRIRSDIRN